MAARPPFINAQPSGNPVYNGHQYNGFMNFENIGDDPGDPLWDDATPDKNPPPPVVLPLIPGKAVGWTGYITDYILIQGLNVYPDSDGHGVQHVYIYDNPDLNGNPLTELIIFEKAVQIYSPIDYNPTVYTKAVEWTPPDDKGYYISIEGVNLLFLGAPNYDNRAYSNVVNDAGLFAAGIVEMASLISLEMVSKTSAVPNNTFRHWFAYNTSVKKASPETNNLVSSTGITATSIGTGFRQTQYCMCKNLTTAADEVLPDTIATFGDDFRVNQYSQCSSLITPAVEVVPLGVTTFSGRYRQGQYDNCSSLTTTAIEVVPLGITAIGPYFRNGQYANCSSLTTPAVEVLPNSITSVGHTFRQGQYSSCNNLLTCAVEVFPNSINNVNEGSYRNGQYANCSSLTTPAEEVFSDTVTALGTYYRAFQYQNCTNLTMAAIEVFHSATVSMGYGFREQQYMDCPNLTSTNAVNTSTLGSTSTLYRTRQYANSSLNSSNPQKYTTGANVIAGSNGIPTEFYG
jgi:hypothetical protein